MNMIKHSPCYGCDKRFVGCHAECGSYAEFKQSNDAMKTEHIKTIKTAQPQWSTNHYNRVMHTLRRKKRGI